MVRVCDLSNRVAIVTGGGGGIGRAISIALASCGASVGVLDVRTDQAQRVCREILTMGAEALAVPCDITSYAEVTDGVEKVCAALGAPDILVNNAGIDIVQPFVETDEGLWRKLIDVNYFGFLCVTHVVARKMIERGSGVIVSVGSDAGRIGNPGDAVYCGTKAAVMATSKALAREFARYGIRVNCVAPGPVKETGLLGGLYEGELGEKIARMIPLRRLGTPDDVADVVLFLVSDASRYLTGQVVAVDGGLTMIG